MITKWKTVSFTSNDGDQNLIVSMVLEQETLIAPTLKIIGTPTVNSITLRWTKVTDPTFANYEL